MGQQWGVVGQYILFYNKNYYYMGVVSMEVKKIWRGCPKCKAEAKDVGMFLDAGGALYVKCLKCGAYTDAYNRWDDAIDAWNKGVV